MEAKAHPEWKELFEKFKNVEYDTFVSHSKIESITGLHRLSEPQKYYSCANRWKKAMLEEASRQVDCDQSRGYRIIKPEEFRGSATRHIKFGAKQMRKAGKIIKNVPMDLLSDDEKRKIGETSTVLAQILHFEKATLKKIKEIDKKTDKLLLDIGKALDVAD